MASPLHSAVITNINEISSTHVHTIVLYATLFVQVGEYRELTEKLVPVKLWREWKALFVAGQPLYPPPEEGTVQRIQGPTPADILELERQAVLNEGDFHEYKVRV